jgi:thiamine biosynthesis lipoprotein
MRAKCNVEVVFLALILPTTSCQTLPPECRFEFSKPQMGAPFRIVLYAGDKSGAESAASAAFRRVEELNAILSDYNTDSELNQLSRTAGSGRTVPVSEDLWKVLAEAQQFSQLSDGAFDITVGPFVGLWRKARREQKFPDTTRLAEAWQAVGYQKVELKNRTARLLAPDMKLDLGGIAKGYAVDEAMKVLKKHGIRRALVAAAGDIAVSDPPPGKPDWQIEIGSPPKIIPLSNAAVSTSGDLFQHLELNGVRYSHIVDPRTGLGLTNQAMVSVIAPNSTTADALATAISVLGPEKGPRLAQKISGVSVEIFK